MIKFLTKSFWDFVSLSLITAYLLGIPAILVFLYRGKSIELLLGSAIAVALYCALAGGIRSFMELVTEGSISEASIRSSRTMTTKLLPHKILKTLFGGPNA